MIPTSATVVYIDSVFLQDKLPWLMRHPETLEGVQELFRRGGPAWFFRPRPEHARRVQNVFAAAINQAGGGTRRPHRTRIQDLARLFDVLDIVRELLEHEPSQRAARDSTGLVTTSVDVSRAANILFDHLAEPWTRSRLSVVVHVSPSHLSASPDAYHFLRHLAVVPVNIPIMRLVQHVTSDHPHLSHLAEVYLSGLLEQVDTDSDIATFDFVPGVRDVLLRTLRRTEALRVLAVVTDLLDMKSHQQQEFIGYLRPGPSSRLDRLAIEPFAAGAGHVLNTVRPTRA